MGTGHTVELLPNRVFTYERRPMATEVDRLREALKDIREKSSSKMQGGNPNERLKWIHERADNALRALAK